ncbi:MAG: hypothetical protein WCB62_28605 [Pseudolabrys sp.]
MNGRMRSAGLSPRRPVTRDHGIGPSLERPHPIQPVQIGMTDEQPGLQRIQIGAIGLPNIS